MKETQPILLVGGGGHCLAAIDVVECTGDYQIVGILDRPEKQGTTLGGYPIIGDDNLIDKYACQGVSFLVTIGQIHDNTQRMQLYRRIVQAGGVLPVVVAPTAYISPTAKIGKGTLVMHHAHVGPQTVVGENCIINTYADVEHNVVIGAGCHLSTRAVINGTTVVGENTFVGSGAVVANNLTIAPGTLIGLGAVVYRSLTEAGVYVGNPLKKR